MVGASDGGDVGRTLGYALGLSVSISVGLLLSSNVGKFVGLDDGYLLGIELGPSDGTAPAQVSQHMAKTVSKEHRNVEFSLAAHAQSCSSPPSSGISKDALPEASPLHTEQQLSQQFVATS